jgi:LPS-assembly protein
MLAILVAALVVSWISAPQAFAQLRAELESTTGTPIPTNIKGKSFIYDSKTDTFIARDNARLVHGPSLLTAGELQFNRNTRDASAIGNVHLVDPIVKIRASRAHLNMDAETGELQNAVITPQAGEYTIAGRLIEKLSGARFHVLDGFFTTCGCEPGTPSWSVSGKSIDCHLGGKAKVEDATVQVLGYPLLTIPYATFPANSKRQSGFVNSYNSESTLRGFQIMEPYFIDLGKTQDATIAPDIETAQRVGLLGEYRRQESTDDYLQVTASAYQEIIPEAQRLAPEADKQIADPFVPTFRYGLIGIMRQHITPTLSIYGDTQTVSDSYFLRDMDVPVLSPGYGFNFTFNRIAPSDLGLLDDFQDSFLQVQINYFQDLIQQQRFALQQLPQAWYQGHTDILNGLAYTDYQASAVEYYRDQGTTGQRVDVSPSVTVPFLWGDYLNAYVTGTAESTAYNYSGNNVDVIPVGTDGRQFNNALVLGSPANTGQYFREIPYGEAGVSSLLERVYNVQWGDIEKLKHTIEPIANYYYVPNIGQGNLPLWDQIDRVDPRSMFYMSVVSRVFAKYKEPAPAPTTTTPPAEAGAENAPPPAAAAAPQPGSTTSIGPLFQPSGNRVQELLEFSITQIYDNLYAIGPNNSHYSDTDIYLSIFPTNVLIASGDTGVNPITHRIDYSYDYLTLRPPESWYQYQARMGQAAIGGTFLQLGYNYVAPINTASVNKALSLANETNQVSANIYYETTRWGGYLGPSYDVANNSLLSAEYGGRIKSVCNCWIVDFGVVQSVNPLEYRFQVMLTLGGVGSVGSSPIPNNPFAVYNPRYFAQPPPPPLNPPEGQ